MGGNGTLETSPPIVHFGGFRTENIHELTVMTAYLTALKSFGRLSITSIPPHRSYSLSKPLVFSAHSSHLLLSFYQVRVINKSDTKQRIHVLPPQTSSFKFDVANNGFIRPGLAQDITITFRPSEYRYYYDCIRLHCPGQNILVRDWPPKHLHRDSFASFRCRSTHIP